MGNHSGGSNKAVGSPLVNSDHVTVPDTVVSEINESNQDRGSTDHVTERYGFDCGSDEYDRHQAALKVIISRSVEYLSTDVQGTSQDYAPSDIMRHLANQTNLRVQGMYPYMFPYQPFYISKQKAKGNTSDR